MLIFYLKAIQYYILSSKSGYINLLGFYISKADLKFLFNCIG